MDYPRIRINLDDGARALEFMGSDGELHCMDLRTVMGLHRQADFGVVHGSNYCFLSTHSYYTLLDLIYPQVVDQDG